MSHEIAKGIIVGAGCGFLGFSAVRAADIFPTYEAIERAKDNLAELPACEEGTLDITLDKEVQQRGTSYTFTCGDSDIPLKVAKADDNSVIVDWEATRKGVEATASQGYLTNLPEQEIDDITVTLGFSVITGGIVGSGVSHIRKTSRRRSRH